MTQYRHKTDYIVVHCADTRPNMDIGAAEIDDWHKERGWSGIGYHHVIRRSGKIEKGRDENAVGAHVEGYNSVSVGICLVGGKAPAGQPENNFTPEQFTALTVLLRAYKTKYPQAVIVGHRDLNHHKQCPCFDVKAWVKENL